MTRKKGGREAEWLRILIVKTSMRDEDGLARALENLPTVEARAPVSGETAGGGNALDAVLIDLALRPGGGTIWVVTEGLSGARMIPLAEEVSKDRYRVEVDNGGGAVVTFGDGAMGARMPTGSANVWASYRIGTGGAGKVSGSTIAVCQERPRGIANVRNPLPAAGGADPETLDDVRRRAPRSLRTLDRTVSESDFEELLMGFLGIASAAVHARPPERKRREGMRRVVKVTVPAEESE